MNKFYKLPTLKKKKRREKRKITMILRIFMRSTRIKSAIKIPGVSEINDRDQKRHHDSRRMDNERDLVILSLSLFARKHSGTRCSPLSRDLDDIVIVNRARGWKSLTGMTTVRVQLPGRGPHVNLIRRDVKAIRERNTFFLPS